MLEVWKLAVPCLLSARTCQISERVKNDGTGAFGGPSAVPAVASEQSSYDRFKRFGVHAKIFSFPYDY